MLRLALAALLLLGSAPMPSPTTPQLLTWPDLTKRPRPAADETVTYGVAPEQKVDLWRPAGPGPHPVVLMIHGGCWQTDIADRSLMNWVAADLRAAGVAVWNIDYRGVDRPGGGYPGTFQDVAAAADWLARTADHYNLDTTRVVAVGHSAGGHLALWVAARAQLPEDSVLSRPGPNTPDRLGTIPDLPPPTTPIDPLRITHAISLGGLPDLEATAKSPDNGCGTEVIAKLTGGRFADTSVPRLLPLGVPQDLVNGREDKIIPYRMATDYVAAARAAGDRVALHTIPNTGHVELVAPETAAWAEAKRLVLAALGPPRSRPGKGTGAAGGIRTQRVPPRHSLPERASAPSRPEKN